MGELEDVQTFVNVCDATVAIVLYGEPMDTKWGKLQLGDMIYSNDYIRTKIDEYTLILHFGSIADYTTYIAALYALCRNFNLRATIAGYVYVANLRNIRISRTIKTKMDNAVSGITRTIILHVTREY